MDKKIKNEHCLNFITRVTFELIPYWIEFAVLLSLGWGVGLEVFMPAKYLINSIMMTSSNGHIFRVTGSLWGESIGGFPSQRSMTQSSYVFFYLRLNKLLNKQSRRLWFGTPSRPFWRHCNAVTEKLTSLDNCNDYYKQMPFHKLRFLSISSDFRNHCSV